MVSSNSLTIEVVTSCPTPVYSLELREDGFLASLSYELQLVELGVSTLRKREGERENVKERERKRSREKEYSDRVSTP